MIGTSAAADAGQGEVFAVSGATGASIWRPATPASGARIDKIPLGFGAALATLGDVAGCATRGQAAARTAVGVRQPTVCPSCSSRRRRRCRHRQSDQGACTSWTARLERSSAHCRLDLPRTCPPREAPNSVRDRLPAGDIERGRQARGRGRGTRLDESLTRSHRIARGDSQGPDPGHALTCWPGVRRSPSDSAHPAGRSLRAAHPRSDFALDDVALTGTGSRSAGRSSAGVHEPTGVGGRLLEVGRRPLTSDSRTAAQTSSVSAPADRRRRIPDAGAAFVVGRRDREVASAQDRPPDPAGRRPTSARIRPEQPCVRDLGGSDVTRCSSSGRRRCHGGQGRAYLLDGKRARRHPCSGPHGSRPGQRRCGSGHAACGVGPARRSRARLGRPGGRRCASSIVRGAARSRRPSATRTGSRALRSARRSRRVGDANGDGFDDLVVGAPGFDHPAAANAGRVYILTSKGPAAAGAPDACVSTGGGTTGGGDGGGGGGGGGDEVTPPGDGRRRRDRACAAAPRFEVGQQARPQERHGFACAAPCRLRATVPCARTARRSRFSGAGPRAAVSRPSRWR